MLKGNLSTRPFYNERLVTLLLATVAILAVVLATYDAKRLVELSARRRTARARVEASQGEATRIRGQAQAQQQAVDPATLRRLADATREANDLIDQRTFSWTALLSLVETTLPMDVRLVSISPRLDKGATKLTLTVVARDLEDVEVFSANLMQSGGAFYDVAPTEQQRQDDGSYSARLEASYLPHHLPPVGAGPIVREKQQ